MARFHPPLPPGDQGRHFTIITSAIPQVLVGTSERNRVALRQLEPEIPIWYTGATQAQKSALKTVVDASWSSLNQWERQMANIQTAVEFAQPLLKEALKSAGHALDVEHTYLRLYVPVEDAFGRRTGGFKSKTFSLLQAALNNFEEPEAAPGFFNSASGFITRPDEILGHFERVTTTLSIDAFASLCRKLDLGGKYQTYLNTQVRPSRVVDQSLLRLRYTTWKKDALKVAAHIALLKGDIGADDFALLLRVASGEKEIKVADKRLVYSTPCLMNLRLQGCVLMQLVAQHRYGTWFIAWFPDDPVQPIKRYQSFAEFQQQLTDRLSVAPQESDRSKADTPTQYQAFISRFVAKKDRPYYFRRLTELVADAPPQSWAAGWMRSERGQFWTKILAPTPFTEVLGDPVHTLRVPAGALNLDIRSVPFHDRWIFIDLWHELYEGFRASVLDDGHSEAIPTAQADASHSARRLSHYLSLGMLVLNAVSMVVPPLGYVMLAVTAAQLVDEVFEGFHELNSGDREAGWSHLGDVLENLVMLGVGGAVLHFTVSPFIEGLKTVTLPSGKIRLWKPDLEPYVRNINIAADSVPSAEGLHSFGRDKILVLEGKPLELKKDPYPGKYRVQHPRRPDAYLPEIRHNGVGGWLNEVEQPLSWEQPRLMRRLGPAMEGFDEIELEQIRRINDVDDDVLRRLHTESEAPPAILMDTARRFRAYADAVKVSELIRSGDLSSPLGQFALPLVTEMPGWPVSWAVEFVEGAGASAKTFSFHRAGQSPEHVLSVGIEALRGGKLPERVVQALSKEQVRHLLRQFHSYVPENVLERARLFQSTLADFAVTARARLFKSLYAHKTPPADAALQVLLRDFKGLPATMGRELLDAARPVELAALNSTGKLPLRLAQQARELQRQVRLVRAYEGLYLDTLANPDTEALVLNTLEALPGWQDNLRLEVRERTYDGELRAGFGPIDAGNRKVIVWSAQGRYQAFDEQANSLHVIDSLYGSIQHALTDLHRTSLSLPHVGQGLQLKALIEQHALPRAQLRKVLHMVPERRSFFVPPSVLPGNRLGYPLSGRGVGLGSWDRGIQERVRSLYPDYTEEAITRLRAANDPASDLWLKALEREYEVLDATLQTWLGTPMEGLGAFGSPRYHAQLLVRSAIVRSLKDAWRRIGPRHYDATGRYLGQLINLMDLDVQLQLRSLPTLTADFGHVTRLDASRSRFNDANLPFLANFPRLLSLNLEACELTQLPSVITQMSRLWELGLAENRIVLEGEAVARLRSLRQLRRLELDGNPLGLAPDVSQMHALRTLWLADTGQTGWPEGLFAAQRPRTFMLDLDANTLSRIPDVAPGSDRAAIVARTVVDRGLMTPEVLSTFDVYVESAGIDPARRFPPKGAGDSAVWNAGMTREQWQAKQPVWEALEDAHDSEPFFNEIRKLSASSDAGNAQYKAELTARVWRMLEAADADPSLRDRLFLMARAPTTCVDAGAQLFNAMGVEVMEWEAYASGRPEVVKLELLDLAKGKSRLDELGTIARARVAELKAQGRPFPAYDGEGHLVEQYDDAGNLLHPLDEVEIHLAYVTGLARRLDLPWQSRSMMFYEPDVTPQMLEAAFERVIELERGDLLRESLLKQQFWTRYLEATNAGAFEVVLNKGNALEQLREAQEAWVANGRLSAAEKAALRKTIDAAGLTLGKPSEELYAGQAMTDAQYTADYVTLAEETQNILRRLCDEAMGRA